MIDVGKYVVQRTNFFIQCERNVWIYEAKVNFPIKSSLIRFKIKQPDGLDNIKECHPPDIDLSATFVQLTEISNELKMDLGTNDEIIKNQLRVDLINEIWKCIKDGKIEQKIYDFDGEFVCTKIIYIDPNIYKERRSK